MPADTSKARYTNKQKRKAGHIKRSYKKQGVSEDEAESRAWATVNKQDGGGKKSGSGRARAKTKTKTKTATRKKSTRAKSTKSSARNGRRTQKKSS